jgi:hypothetical protein
MLLVDRADKLVRIQDLEALHDLNVAGRDFTFFVHGQRELARLMFRSFEFHPLQVQHDVGDVFHDTGQGREFVLRAGDLHRGDRCALEGRKQDAAE